MAYVTKEYYDNIFHGEEIEERKFNRLADIASDIIDAMIFQPITDDVDKDQLAKAAAYQVECIELNGGILAIAGLSESQMDVSEKLDDYWITTSKSSYAEQRQLTFNGIPVSSITLSILRNQGLMYKGVSTCGKRCCNGL